MLRINLLHDEAFRNDILGLVKNGLREAVPKAIAEKFAEDGWLDKRFDAALARLDLPSRLGAFLRTRDLWESKLVRDAIDYVASARNNQAVTDLKERFERAFQERVLSMETSLRAHAAGVIDDYAKRLLGQEDRIRAIVGEELRKRLAAG